jgi:hypothetical protein
MPGGAIPGGGAMPGGAPIPGGVPCRVEAPFPEVPFQEEEETPYIQIQEEDAPRFRWEVETSSKLISTFQELLSGTRHFQRP